MLVDDIIQVSISELSFMFDSVCAILETTV